jgi:hypothetical protein
MSVFLPTIVEAIEVWRFCPLVLVCGNENETIVQVLRDCVHATQIWIKLVASYYITNFF